MVLFSKRKILIDIHAAARKFHVSCPVKYVVGLFELVPL